MRSKQAGNIVAGEGALKMRVSIWGHLKVSFGH